MNYMTPNITNFHHVSKGGRMKDQIAISSITQHELVISEITPCEGSSYFTLP